MNVAACVLTGPVDGLGYKYPGTSAQSPGILLGWFPHMEHVRKYDTGNYKPLIHVQFPLIYVQEQAYVLFIITPTGSPPPKSCINLQFYSRRGWKKWPSISAKTPQFQQQVAPNGEPAAFFRRTGVKRRAVRVMEGVRSVHLPGNSATGSQFPRQTEGLRAIWTFWLAPSTESAARRNTHGHGFLEGTAGTEHI